MLYKLAQDNRSTLSRMARGRFVRQNLPFPFRSTNDLSIGPINIPRIRYLAVSGRYRVWEMSMKILVRHDANEYADGESR